MALDWKFTRRILVIAGIAFLIGAIPAAIKPSWSAAPFRKPDQTITVPALNSSGKTPDDLKSKIKNSCLSPTLLRWLMGSAHHVRVVVTWDEKPVAVREYNCEVYI